MESAYPINELKVYHVSGDKPEVAWEQLQQDCPILSDWGRDRLRDGLDGHVQTIACKPYYNCKDHRNLYSHFYSKRFLPVSPNCSRLHFFARPGVTPEQILLGSDNLQKDYLGYSVIRPVARRCLGRTVIDPAKIGMSFGEGFYLLRTAFHACINGRRYKVEGYPYTSQDADATLCAQSAIWGVCRYLSERYSCYQELYPYDLISMTETSQGRAVPYRGMTHTDYCKILNEFGTFPVYRMVQRPNQAGGFDWDAEAYKDICSYVESGFPVLASLRKGTEGHVVSLVGHTLKPDFPKVDEAAFLDSSDLLHQFIVVDDNWFPYALLGPDGDLENYSDKYSIKSMVVGVCPLPEKVFLTAKLARTKAMTYCDSAKAEIQKTGKGPYITRLFIATATSFKKKKLGSLNDQASAFVTKLHLPHFLWIMEVGPAEMYRKGQVTTEIVLDPTAGLFENGIIYMRVGNTVTVMSGSKTLKKSLEAPAAFPLYTHNLGEKSA